MKMSDSVLEKDHCFTAFKETVSVTDLPDKFTFPFYYEPHDLSVLAARRLQDYLETQTDWIHNFGLGKDDEGTAIGKMFGVMVVKNKEGQLGFLSAFSGKLANSNHHKGFVPPVFDMLREGSFFRKEEVEINALTKRIELLEANPEIEKARHFLIEEKALMHERLEAQREKARLAKKERKLWRKEAEQTLEGSALDERLGNIKHESLCFKFYMKDLLHYWNLRITMAEKRLGRYTNEIEALKEQRRAHSADLQGRLFEQYSFLNANGDWKSLGAIFKKTIFEIPPAGAGECAAPKLLHYAYKHGYEPICMAEFWWGQSPKSEIRKHKNYYPACRGKCEPILGHMLVGLEVDENPMLKNPALGKQIQIEYEDEYMLVINKPADFLSVPGKNIQDSVQQRMKRKYQEATGPMVVHRLDMATSGLMLIAKSREIHKALQAQFIDRSIKKRYEALLDGLIEGEKGRIELPLRVDMEDRPRQLVCHEHGKAARTIWEVIERREGKTKVYFYPITGRTHQLRVHASHAEGLNTAIVGDDLYGTKANRLHLHAAFIQFEHPVSGKTMRIKADAPF